MSPPHLPEPGIPGGVHRLRFFRLTFLFLKVDLKMQVQPSIKKQCSWLDVFVRKTIGFTTDGRIKHRKGMIIVTVGEHCLRI